MCIRDSLVVAVEVGVVLAALLFMGRMAQISDVSAIKNELLENCLLYTSKEEPIRFL